jgi:DNA-binding cell septation regulator SpoVG
MNWLSEDCVIDLEVLKGQEYPYFDGVFQEEVDVALLHTVLNDETMVTEYEFVDIEGEDGEIVTVRQEKYVNGELQQHPLYAKTQKNEIKKILKNIKNENKNEVTYSGRSKDNT